MSDHVFVDESERSTYLLCGAVLDTSQHDPVRRVLSAHRKPGQRRLHFNHESDSRRRTILSALVRTEVRLRIYQASGKPTVARAACLTQLTTDLALLNVRRMVVEAQAGQEEPDRRIIYRAMSLVGQRFDYTHLRPHEEPLLWMADAGAWAYGAGGRWRRSLDPVLDKVVLIGA